MSIVCQTCGEQIPTELGLKPGDCCPFCFSVLNDCCPELAEPKEIPCVLSDYRGEDGGLRTLSDNEVERAFHELMSAAEQGSGEAEFLLGQMYATGKGTKIDKVRAKELFKRASEKGVVQASIALLEI